ncbi:MAG: glycoside hydrolase family 36 protein [Melioribacteraceae bacterium]
MRVNFRILSKLFLIFILHTFLLTSNFAKDNKNIRVDGNGITLEFNDQLKSRVISKINNIEIILGDFNESEYLTSSGSKRIADFKLTEFTKADISDNIGHGVQFNITGKNSLFIKDLSIVSYNNFPNFLFLNVKYTNASDSDITIEKWTNNNYNFDAKQQNDHSPFFWSYQPGSYGWENHWIQEIKKGYERDNYLGMNNIDYGGGTPILDIWRKDIGLAIGHVELKPKFVSLPTTFKKNNEAEIAINYFKELTIKPGESLNTFRTFVSVHKGDYFETLYQFSKVMDLQGISIDIASKYGYETEWCGWGFEEKFTMDQFFGALPMVKKLGIDCITLDMGWEDAGYGEYILPKRRFPNGDADMKNVVDSIHSFGKKARLWWMPLSVFPKTDLFTDHPEYMIFNKEQSPIYIHFWESFFLCPAYDKVQEMTKNFVIRAIRDWGWDGLKIDGNSLNTVPPCYNPEHHHVNPEESVEALPDLFKLIYNTAKSINPEVVIQICPCGTNQSFYILPYLNQTVSSDPHNSWDVRIKGKTLFGLTRGKIPFSGDHVELSDDKSDFASTVGIGGVIATKFVWPVGSHENKETGDITLGPEKEKKWNKWLKIYNENQLPKGKYMGELYDIGFDIPETHTIQKDDLMYYALYADKFTGEVELRGLKNKAYKIIDYENSKDLGEVTGPTAKLPVKFEKHLLIKAVPN